jgi:hypothetical protein
LKTPKARGGAKNELTLSELRSELNALSDKISTQLRAVNLGVLGLVWLLLLKKAEVQTLAASIPETTLLLIALFCIVALLLELLQYLLGEWVVDRAYDVAEASASKTTSYDADSFAYRGQAWCYHLKKLLTVGAALWLVVEIGRALI